MKKRIAAFILAVMMVLTLLPVSALADSDVCEINGTGYADLTSALAAAQDGDTIMLLCDIIYNSEITLADQGRVELDLNGFTLTVNTAGDTAISTTDSALSFIDDSGDDPGAVVIHGDISAVATDSSGATYGESYGLLADKGVTVTVNGDVTATGDSARGVKAQNDSFVTVGGDVVVTAIGDGWSAEANGVKADSSTIEVGGSVTATTTGDGSSCYGVYADYATVEVGEGVEASGTCSVSGVYASNAEIEVSGDVSATAIGDNSASTGVYTYVSTVEITGSVTAISSGDYCYGSKGVDTSSYVSTVNIGGDITAISDGIATGVTSRYGSTIDVGGNIAVTGADGDCFGVDVSSSGINVTGSVEAAAVNGDCYGVKAVFSNNTKTADSTVAIGGSITANADGDNCDAYGVNAQLSYYAAADAIVTVGGSIEATASGEYSYSSGVEAVDVNDYDDGGDYTLTVMVDGGVNAAADGESSSSYGAFIEGGVEVTIHGDVSAKDADYSTAVFARTDATAIVGGDVSAANNGVCNGVNASNGAVAEIRGGVSVTGVGSATNGDIFGVNAYSAIVEITGDVSVTATDGDGYGILAGDSVVSVGGNVTAAAPNGVCTGVFAYDYHVIAVVTIDGMLTATGGAACYISLDGTEKAEGEYENPTGKDFYFIYTDNTSYVYVRDPDAAVIDPASKTFTAATVGYATQTAQEFTVTNNTDSSTAASLSASLLNGTSFEISAALSGTSVNAGGTVTVSVRPKTGLSAGTYTDTLTVTGDNGISLTANLSFTVNNTYTATVTPTSMTFTAATAGYDTQTAQAFTMTNTGTGTISSLSASLLGGSHFEISTALSGTSVNAGGTVTVSVRPKTGLSAGIYTDTLSVTGDNGINLTTSLSFTVNAAGSSTTDDEVYARLDLSKASRIGGTGSVTYNQDASISVSDVAGLIIPLIYEMEPGERVNVIIQGSYAGSGVRCFLATTEYSLAADTTAYGYMDPGSFPSEATLTETDFGFIWEFSQRAINTAPYLLIKGHQDGGNLTGSLMIYDISIETPRADYNNVTLNTNGGSSEPLTNYIYGVGATLPTPAKVGYTFAGWYDNAGLTGSPITEITTTDTGVKEYWAKWTANSYTITFNGNGGSVSPVSGITGTDGKLASLPTPIRTGYSFNGWFTASSGGTEVTINTIFSTTTTIYAQWASNSDDGGGSSGGGGGGSSGTTTTTNPTPVPETPSSNVIVDGKEVDIGTVETKDDTTTVTVNQETINKQLETATTNVTITVPAGTGTAAAVLVAQNVDDMAAKDMTLTVQVGGVQYEMPTAAIDTGTILAMLGTSNATDVTISIAITTDMSASAQAAVEAALESGTELVLPPMEFKITASYNGQTVEIDTFSQYVTRSVEITAEQAAKITTAVVINPDGTTRQVPTRVYEKDGKWYAEVSSLTNSTYAFVSNEKTFTDAKGKWYEDAVNEMGSRMIIAGFGNDTFAGERDITRAEFAAAVIQALGLPATGNGEVFADVSRSAWYCGAVGTAYEYGLVAGVGGNQFAPDKKINRQESMALIQHAAKIAGFIGSTGTLNAYSDSESVSAWALDAAQWNVGSSLIVGSNGKIRPLDNITRAETATLVLKLLQKAGLVDARTPLTTAQAMNTASTIAYVLRKEPDAISMPDDNEDEIKS